MNTTPTPRTDSESTLSHSDYKPSEIVPASFARELERENVELREALKECLEYIEMKLAHTGAQNVEQILAALTQVKRSTASCETAHHLGCSKTTRRVDLDKARSLLLKHQ